MYADLFSSFENVKNLGGKAWEHAVALDLLITSKIVECDNLLKELLQFTA